MNQYSITSVPSNTTKILPCREGDVLVWVKDQARPFDLHVELGIADLWTPRNGESILITNRLEDLPPWHALHPTMVGGRNVPLMVNKLNNGLSVLERSLEEISDAWKIHSHQYVIWIGEARTDFPSYRGILGIFRFEIGSIAILQNNTYSLSDIVGDDADGLSSRLKNELATNLGNMLEYLKREGKQRKYVKDWRLG